MKLNHCPVCGSNQLKDLLTLENIPVFVNALAATAAQAKAIVRGTQQLAQCSSCGFVFNRSFEPEKVIYGEDYHAERGSSNAYCRHMSKALDLIESVEPLRGKRVLEVACGTGEFLQLAMRRKPQYCVGIDPSANESGCGDLAIDQAFFDREYLRKHPQKIDILINRHMIEHMQEPLEMLCLFADVLPQGGLLYIETPRLDWILEDRVFYDFPYEHCSYYSDSFMKRLLQAAGFSVAVMRSSYEGQYFSICAYKQGEPSMIELAEETELQSVLRGFEAMKQVFREHKTDPSWAAHEETARFPHSDGIYLWGAAAKGVMCANLVKEIPISGYIDQNPYKQGKFIPGTGHSVFSPEVISYPTVKMILVENDVYLSEIQDIVRRIDIRIRVFSLNTLLGIGTDRDA